MTGQHPRIPFTQSPNAERSGANSLDFIILHGSGGSEAGSEAWIVNPIAQVSYHYFIGKSDRTLEDVRQFVNEFDIAWHAGQSRWREQPTEPGATPRVWNGLNQHSIGVSFESWNQPDEKYPENQLALGRELVLHLMRTHSIPAHRVLTHRMVSDPPGRKIDPVNFPYEDFIRSLHHEQRVALPPRLKELEDLRLFLDNEYDSRIAAARIVGDKLYINRKVEE